MTTREDISRWFDDGVRRGATHLIVVCDTFDHEDFPVYVMPGEDSREVAGKHDDYSKMLRVMEVYALRRDKQSQLAEFRAYHLDSD